ncbi:MAG: hypothetical protein ACP5NY_00985 [Thermocladium sp.]
MRSFIVLPRIVLTIGHPCVRIKMSGRTMAIVMDSKGRINFAKGCRGRHIRIKPFRSIDSTDTVERPLIGRGSYYFTIYTVYRGEAFMYDITISKQGKVEQYRDEAGEDLVRGAVVSESTAQYLRFMLETLLDRYLVTPTPILIMSAKLTIDSAIIDRIIRPHASDDYASSEYRVYHSPGFMAAVKSLTPHRSDVTVIGRIDRADSFKAAALDVLLDSSIIHSMTLGRSGRIPIGIDVFYPVSRRLLAHQ